MQKEIVQEKLLLNKKMNKEQIISEELTPKEQKKLARLKSSGYTEITPKQYKSQESGYDYTSVGSGIDIVYLRKQKKQTPPKPDPNKPKPDPNKPKPDPDNKSPEFAGWALTNVQKLKNKGLVVSCDETFPLKFKKDGKFCQNSKIGQINKCFFNHDLEGIFGEDLTDYLEDLRFNIEDGLSESSFKELMDVCAVQESKKNIKKIIKENTTKILIEYLNK